MLTVHAFSPFAYVEKFNIQSITAAHDTTYHCVCIPRGSVSAFVITPSPCETAPAQEQIVSSNVQVILDLFASVPTGHFLPTARSSQQHSNIRDGGPEQPADIFQITQLKLIQLSAHIDPIIQFHKKCNGNKSQLSPELFFYEDLAADPSVCKRGFVYSSNNCIWKTEFGSYYIPERSCFYWGDVRVGLRSLSFLSSARHTEQKQPGLGDGVGYNTIVLDPPWRNKSARRGNKYQMGFSNKDLLALGSNLKAVMNPAGCVLAIWVTNNNTFAFVKDTLFPEWGVQFVAVWWWLKIKSSKEALYDVMSSKKTYERVVIGYFGPFKLPINPQATPAVSFSLDVDENNHETETSCSIGKRKVVVDVKTSPQQCAAEGIQRGVDFKDKQPLDLIDGHYTPDICSSTQSSWLLDKNKFRPLPADHNSHGFSLTAMHPIPLGRELSADPSKDESFTFPIHVITSVPVRHSWKPPLQHLLQLSLESVNQSFLLADITAQTSSISPAADLETTVQGIAKTADSRDCEDVSLLGGDLEIFARWVRGTRALCLRCCLPRRA
jgi:hypothetical protein